jgi:hypothetical protein
MKGLTNNYALYKEACLQKINNMFLAVKFKVRFKNNFCRNFGRVQDERFRKYSLRHLTLLGNCFYENKCEKSALIIQETLRRSEFIRTFKSNTRKVMD